jgi:hypothetical protein
MKRLLWILLLLFLSYSMADSATLWLDPSLVSDCTSGNYDSTARDCGGSEGNAYNTPNDLDSVVSTGDTVEIRGDDKTSVNDLGFAPAATPSSEGERITYRCYQSETCIFRGDPSGNWFLYLSSTASYYTFEGIEFRDITAGGAWRSDGDQNIFKDMSVVDCDTGTIGACVYIGYPASPSMATGTVIDNIYIDEVGGLGNSIDGIALKCAQSTLITGGYIGRVTHAGITAYNCDQDFDHKILVTGVTFEQKWRYAINHYWSSIDEAGEYIVEKSTFKNQGTIANPASPSGACGADLQIGSTTDMVVRFNEFYGGNAGVLLGCGGSSGQDTSAYFFHNTFYNMQADCVDASYYKGMMVAADLTSANTVNFNNVRFQNNIFSETEQTWGMLINFNLFGSDKNPINSRWEANIFYDSTDSNSNRIDEWIDGGGRQHCTGWEDSDGTQWIDGTCFTTQNPNFTDPSNADFTLQSDSIAINTGVFLATQSGAPSQNMITVGSGEARYFFSKETYGITYAGVVSDTVYDDDGNSAVITAINYASNTITLSDATGFTDGDKLTMVDFKSSAPDIGASEYVPPATEQSDIDGLELN